MNTNIQWIYNMCRVHDNIEYKIENLQWCNITMICDHIDLKQVIHNHDKCHCI